MASMRWTTRLAGLASLAVLARLLDKEDFGLMAMASAAVALPTVLLDTGLQQAIIREQRPERGIYNTAWTVQLCQMLLVAFLLYVSAPWLSAYFGDHRLQDILEVLAMVVIVHGIENLWVVSFRKDLRFQIDFLYNTSSKLLGVAITITLAFYFQSYWALVYGQLSAALIKVVISMVIAPELPRFTFSHIRKLWGFSQWALVRGFAAYTTRHLDRLVLGRLYDAEAVGGYSIAKEIAVTPTAEIAGPLNRALGPGFSEIQDNAVRLSGAVIKSVGAIVTVALPLGCGLAAVSKEAVPVLLGPGWESIVPILGILALAGSINAISGVMGVGLTMTGHVSTDALLRWIRAILLFGFGLPLAVSYGSVGFASGALFAQGVMLGVTIAFLKFHYRALSIRKLFTAMVRPITGTALMIISIMLYQYLISEQSALLLLVQKVLLGGMIYSITVLFLWRLQGKPSGLESELIEKLSLLTRS